MSKSKRIAARLKPAEQKMLMEAMKAVKFDWEDNPSFSQSPRGGGGDFWQWIDKDFDEFADQLDDQLKSSFPHLESDESGYADLASMPKREYLYLATKMASKRIALKADKYVAINHLDDDHIEVAVVGIDGRVIQSNESYLIRAIKKMDVDVDNTNPRKVPVPDHDPDTQNDPGWGWMGFNVYADPEEMGDVVAALKKEAKALHMKVYEAKGKWPKAPRMASQRKTTKKATDRQLLIRLASSMEKGSEERKAILNALKGASTKSATRFPAPMGPTELVEWAAQEAAEVLTKNWKQALKDDPSFSTDVMVHDIAQVMESLNKWKGKIQGMRMAGLAMDEDDYFAAAKTIREAILEISEILDETYDSDLINGFYKLLRKHERSSTGHPFKLAGMKVDSDDYFKMMKEVRAFFKELDQLMDAAYFDGDERDKVERIISGLSRQYRFASLKKTARTMAEFKKEMDKVNRVFNKLMDDYQKAQRTYSDFNEHYEYADYDEGEEDRQQVMELGSKWLADTRRSDKKTLDAIKKFVASIDPAELKENARAESLHKDLNKQLQEVERNIKSKPKDWKEMGKAIHWKTGPRLFRDAGAYMSRLVEAISGESL